MGCLKPRALREEERRMHGKRQFTVEGVASLKQH
jgi:hypothetical protein